MGCAASLPVSDLDDGALRRRPSRTVAVRKTHGFVFCQSGAHNRAPRREGADASPDTNVTKPRLPAAEQGQPQMSHTSSAVHSKVEKRSQALSPPHRTRESRVHTSHVESHPLLTNPLLADALSREDSVPSMPGHHTPRMSLQSITGPLRHDDPPTPNSRSSSGSRSVKAALCVRSVSDGKATPPPMYAHRDVQPSCDCVTSTHDFLSECASVASSAARPAREKKRYVSMKAVVSDEESSDYFGSVARRQTTALSCFAPPSAPASPPKAGVVCEAAVGAMPRGVASAPGLCLMPSDWRSPHGPPRSTAGSVVSLGGSESTTTASHPRLTPLEQWHTPPRTPQSDHLTTTSETDEEGRLPLSRWMSVESEHSDISATTATAPKISLFSRASQVPNTSTRSAQEMQRAFRRPFERHRSAERAPPVRASIAPFPCLAPPPASMVIRSSPM